MNDRQRRFMRNMKRDDPKRYKGAKLCELSSNLWVAAKDFYNAIECLFKKKPKPIKWHKHNKRWAK